MEKHKFNIFPEMAAEEFEKLKADLVANGFDPTQPIYIFEDAILDGWNRYRACGELGIGYAKEVFTGSAIEAVNFVMRTNTRRNLSSGQRAALATEAEEIIQFISEATEIERRQKQADSQRQAYEAKNCLIGGADSGSCLPQATSEDDSEEFPDLIYEYEEKSDTRDQNKVATKLAKTFNTNRTYVQDARKIKQASPEVFEKVKSGEMKIADAKREVLTDEARNIIQKKAEIKNGAGQKFRETIYKIRVQLDDTGDIQKLTASWDLEYIAHWLKELRKLQAQIGGIADQLEEIVNEKG